MGPEASRMDHLMLGVMWYLIFLFSTTLHEAAHAWAALRLGDPTAYEGGQVSLDPLPHVRREPIGTVVAPILSFLVGGWMIGWASAPYDPEWAERHPRRAAWMALAGPAANLLLVLVAAIAIRGGLWAGLFTPPDRLRMSVVTLGAAPGVLDCLARTVSLLFSLNLVLFVFNLIPMPPLDGSGALPLVMSEETARGYQALAGRLGMMGILVAWQVFDPIFRPIFLGSVGLLYQGIGGG
jgi:Zn-dependent protease